MKKLICLMLVYTLALGVFMFNLDGIDNSKTIESTNITINGYGSRSPTSGYKYYVSTSGNNNANGSSESTAWRTLTYALSQISGGDTIYVKDGLYIDNPYVYNSKSGTFASPTKIIGYHSTPGDNPTTKYHCPNFDGGSDGLALLSGCSYVDVSHFWYTNCSSKGLDVVNAKNCNFDNIFVDEAGNIGINIEGDYCSLTNSYNLNHHSVGWRFTGDNCIADNVTTELSKRVASYQMQCTGNYNIIRNSTTTFTGNDGTNGRGFMIRDGATGNLIENCTTYDAGLSLIIYINAHHNTIKNCKAYGVSGRSTAIVSGSGTHDNVWRNITASHCEYGIKMEDMESKGEPIDGLIEGCTFIDCQVGYKGNTGDDHTIKNCIFDTIAAGWNRAVHSLSSSCTGNIMRNCIIYNYSLTGAVFDGGTGIVNTTYCCFYNNDFTLPSGKGNIKINPMFADIENKDYHLKSKFGRWDNDKWVVDSATSPCIDAGDPTNDYFNEPQPNGGRINMGIYGNTSFASKSTATLRIITKDITETLEDNEYKVNYFASGLNLSLIDWSYSSNASWLNWGIINNTLFGIPTNSNIGTFWVNISVSEGKSGFDFTNFTLTVINTNDPPVISTADITTITEDLFYSVTYNATDIDPIPDKLTWLLSTNASWLSIKSDTGILSGTPTNANVGTFWVNVSVTDGKGGHDWSNFNLTVINTNDPPEIITLDITSATENIIYSNLYDAIDIDPTEDTLSWSLNTNASWLSIKSTTGYLYGTPSESDFGWFWVNVSVTDLKNGIDWSNFTLTVTKTIDPPVITTQDVKTATEDLFYLVDYNATADNTTITTLSWSLSTNASWLSIKSDTGILSGAPTNANVGTFWVNISVNDGKDGVDWTNFTISVINVNDPPTINTIDIKTASENVLYSNTYMANDIDPTSDTLVWFLTTNASWLSISSTTGTLTGIPTNSDIGTFWVNVSVSDGNGGKDYHNFTLRVSKVNNPPDIITVDLLKATEDQLYNRIYKAKDIDSTENDLTWKFSSNAHFLKFELDTGLLYGTPTNSEVGVYWVNISIWDERDGMDFTNFSLTVVNTNDPPIISNSDEITCKEDLIYKVEYSANDIDPTNDDLTWSLSSNTSFLSIDPITGVLSGIPLNSDVGKYWVNVSVSDGNGGFDFSYFILTVFNVNDAPSIITVDILTCYEDELYQVDYQALDVDPSNDVLVWTLSTNALFLSIDSKTGILLGAPGNDEVGNYWVNISVLDGNDGLDFTNFDLTVLNTNDPPKIESLDVTITNEDQLYQVDYDAFDMDPTGDIITWSLSTNAQFLSLDPVTGMLSGIPSNNDVGGYWINISISDGKGGFDFRYFILSVININDPPTITNLDITSSFEDQLYHVNYNAMDIDPSEDTLTWKLSTNAPFLSMEPINGLLSGIPENADVGTYWVNVSVWDGNGGYDSHNFTLSVFNVNDPPDEVMIELEDMDYIEDRYQPARGKATDPDIPYNDELTFEWYSDLVGKIGIGQTINLSLPAGIHIITLDVTDKEGALSNVSIELEILPNQNLGEDKDTDGDGFLDLWEEFLGTNPIDPRSKPLDTDFDGIPNGDQNNSQSWMDIDDDNDGHSDQKELDAGTDPLNEKSKPKGRKDNKNNGNNAIVLNINDNWFVLILIVAFLLISIMFTFILVLKRKKSRDIKEEVIEEEKDIKRLPIKTPAKKIPIKKPSKKLIQSPIKNQSSEIPLSTQQPLICMNPQSKLDAEVEDSSYECPSCGKDLNKEDIICPKCNEEFEVDCEEYDYVCPDCGTSIGKEIILCPKCGAVFEEETE